MNAATNSSASPLSKRFASRQPRARIGGVAVSDKNALRAPSRTTQFMMPARKSNPRVEYRLRQNQRVKDSISLGEKFPKLKALTVDLAYFDSEGLTKSSEMKYKVNVQHAKSVFCFVCQSGECIGGDFDLSEALAKA